MKNLFAALFPKFPDVAHHFVGFNPYFLKCLLQVGVALCGIFSKYYICQTSLRVNESQCKY